MDRCAHTMNTSRNFPVYDKCLTQLAKVLALPPEWAYQDDSSNTPQHMCEFQVSFPLLRIRINLDKR